ncbi:MAG: glycerol-3-phosphate dehydrogenase subunit GlpB [Propionibacteriaceae bacterium]|jgi:glycerol-3-phosphate dehydrogenase subunit B|nr:glycerol-3-phosphate dehydrogenase subunit GlpB [Propionibacteriaceae bacterium]
MTDTVVIGAGLAGLTAAIRLAEEGQSVTLLTFGVGGIQLSQGTIDVLGYRDNKLTPKPFTSLAKTSDPGHPYSILAPSTVEKAVDWFAAQLPDLLLPGDEANHLVPTALGAMRPTYLRQPSMVWPDPGSVAVVGPRQIKDFYPELMAANLERTTTVKATGYHIDLPAREGEVDSSPIVYAQALDDSEFLMRFAKAISSVISNEDAICLPAILGLRTCAHMTLVEALGRPVIETLLPPPSIPGMRLNEALLTRAKALGVRVILGSKVTGFETQKSRVTSVILHQAGRDQGYSADNFVYAGGGFESGALAMDSYGKISETLFGLPLVGADQDDLITGDYWADQKLFRVGVEVDEIMRVLDKKKVVYSNLYATGGLLAGATRWVEKSGDGIAIASAYRATESILGEVK